MIKHVDMVVVGSGPAGQKAAIQAAKLGKQVVLIERNPILGGVCTHTGTIPSKALREAVLHLAGSGADRFGGGSPDMSRRPVTIEDLIMRGRQVIRTEIDVIREHMVRNGVELTCGEARFDDPNTLSVVRGHGADMYHSDYVVIATGTVPARPAHVPFDGERVLDSDDLLKIAALPKSMIIVGGGVIGTEYACMMATLGVRVILTEARPSLLEFVDSEISEALQYRMRSMGVTLRLGERVDEIRALPDGLVQATLQSGKHLRADTLLYCIGRQGTTDKLGLENVGLTPDNRGRLKVNENYQTDVPHVYAVGDVIGFPALASTSMEQGRQASCHAFGEPTTSLPELFPLGIYAIPEISMVGKTEAQLTAEGVPYEAGVAQYREIARGQLLGDEVGMLKLLIHEQTRQILGVHAIGTGATELIHIGQAVMTLGGTVDFFINNVFNYPTLAECYKVAALNGSNKLRLLRSGWDHPSADEDMAGPDHLPAAVAA
ncbi:MAG: Si-specific NAD(P)(+) transhydrogenase [Armatimonadetes bacterium]|nr:Si-specific NAD(P)(+) transhydrogenase [Armatimonadota bacterium]